jgi:hypothetical protein
MTKPIQLHVGYVGITREGKRVEIIDDRGSNVVYRWRGKPDEVYTNDGRFWLSRADCNFDIIGPWVETPVEPLVDYKSHSDANYNDGKWHRWAGGECPVHPSSVVHATFLVGIGEPRTESRAAHMFVWGDCASPIVAFRVTKEYVEPPKVPREFWVFPSSHIVRTDEPDDTTGYTHVREVLTDD